MALLFRNNNVTGIGQKNSDFSNGTIVTKSRDNFFYKSLKMLDLFRNVKEKNPFSSKIAFFI